MWNKIKKMIEPFLGYIVVIAVVAFVVAILAMLGGVYMHIFGFRYESVEVLILFFVVVAFVSFPLEIVSTLITKKLASLGLIKSNNGLTYILIDTICTYISMRTVDYFMENIISTRASVLIFAFTLSLVTVYTDKKVLKD